jgi:hypothetical protein
MLKRQFIVMSAYIKISERFQVNNPMIYLKLLQKQLQAKSKGSTCK